MILENVSFKEFLSTEFIKRTRLNARYSQRAFARDLRLSPGELSELLRGKRHLTTKMAAKIGQSLGLSGFERQQLFAWVQNEDLDVDTLREKKVLKEDIALFELITDPVTNAIFCLTDVDDFKLNSNWIAKRLGIRVLEVEMALKKLERFQVIERKGRDLVINYSKLSSPGEVPSESVRKLHHYYLDQAQRAIDLQHINSRHLNGLSFALALKDLPLIKKEISAFVEHIANKYSKKQKKKDAIYHLESALFRIDQGRKNEDV